MFWVFDILVKEKVITFSLAKLSPMFGRAYQAPPHDKRVNDILYTLFFLLIIVATGWLLFLLKHPERAIITMFHHHEIKAIHGVAAPKPESAMNEE